MAKRNKVQSDGEFGVKESIESQQVDFVPLKLRLSATYVTRGSSSGEEYRWTGAGSILMVRAEDVEELLSRTRPVSCCGTNNKTNIFEIGE